VDYLLTQKYEMTFEEFIAQRVAQQEGYTWDVETDAMDWEAAVGGMNALIEGGRRIFGIDRDADEWHVHPYKAPHTHEPLPDGLEPKPLLKFLARVEDLLLQHDLL